MSDIAERVKKIVVEHLGVDEAKVTEDASFIDDLGADSLDTVELVMAFEEEFGVEIPDDAAEKIVTVARRGRLHQGARGELRARGGRQACRGSSDEAGGRHRARARHTARFGGRDRLAAPARRPVGPAPDRAFRRQRPAGQGRRRGAEGCRGRGSSTPPTTWSRRSSRRNDEFIVFGMGAATQAIRDSGFEPANDEERERAGVMIGSGIGGLNAIAETTLILEKGGPRRVSPFFIPSALINLASGQISIRFGLQGPEPRRRHRLLDRRARDRRRGAADPDRRRRRHGGGRLRGGARAARPRRLRRRQGALDRLQRHAREGLAALGQGPRRLRDGRGRGGVVLEEYEHAKRRGAKIYAEVKGYGLSGDAYHITAPARKGRAATAPCGWRSSAPA